MNVSATHDLAGRRFGRLFVTSKAGSQSLPASVKTRRRSYWHVTCDCGKRRTVLASSLVAGLTTSCGCLRADMLKERFRKQRAAKAKREGNAKRKHFAKRRPDGTPIPNAEQAIAAALGIPSRPPIDRTPKRWSGARPAAADLAAVLGLAARPRAR